MQKVTDLPEGMTLQMLSDAEHAVWRWMEREMCGDDNPKGLAILLYNLYFGLEEESALTAFLRRKA